MKNIVTALKALLTEALTNINQTTDQKQLYRYQQEYFGKTSLFSTARTHLKVIPSEDKEAFGTELNNFKAAITQALKNQRQIITSMILDQAHAREKIDATFSPYEWSSLKPHILKQIQNQITTFFKNRNYHIILGDEVANISNNFDQLNINSSHPARLNDDTFFLDNHKLLRTHCTATTAELLSLATSHTEWLAAISIGHVYRRDDDDRTHSHQFQQIDGICVGPGVNFAHLKTLLIEFCQELFGSDQKILLRPSYFPFTEPSIEVDVMCPLGQTDSCQACHGTGYIEILGAGLIDPQVFKFTNKPANWSGFAFGLGLDRVAMIKYKISDIRHLYQNDLRFLKQFS